MSASAEPKVFVSYRREETAGHAGRLHDAVAARFGDDNVFMDVEIPPGVDFVEWITKAICACRAFVAVIGPRWAQPVDGHATARIAEPGDFVRLEIETALQCPDVMVFPVLVGGARMPASAQLPESLRPLARRNALELSDLRWPYDTGRLNDALQDLLADAVDDAGDADPDPVPVGPTKPPKAKPRPARVWSLLPLLAEGIAVAVAAGVAGHALATWLATSSSLSLIAGTIARRAITWSIVAAALGAWLTLRRGESRRIAGRTLAGLALGALAGGLGGALYVLPNILDAHVSLSDADRANLALGSLAATGGLLGLAIGALWIPPRAFVGLLAGVVGGLLVQDAINGVHRPSPTAAVAFQCLAIVGLTLTALLALDVRAASAVAPVPLPAPQPVADR